MHATHFLALALADVGLLVLRQRKKKKKTLSKLVPPYILPFLPELGYGFYGSEVFRVSIQLFLSANKCKKCIAALCCYLALVMCSVIALVKFSSWVSGCVLKHHLNQTCGGRRKVSCMQCIVSDITEIANWLTVYILNKYKQSISVFNFIWLLLTFVVLLCFLFYLWIFKENPACNFFVCFCFI